MPDIFGEDIAGELFRELGPLLFDVILVQVTGKERDSANPTKITEFTKKFTGKGFVDDYKARQIDGMTIQQGDRKVTILGASLPAGVVPKPSDSTIIEGETKVVVNVIRDPASAVYECQVEI